eukprot:3580589-Amphidinium_carterae.1
MAIVVTTHMRIVHLAIFVAHFIRPHNLTKTSIVTGVWFFLYATSAGGGVSRSGRVANGCACFAPGNAWGSRSTGSHQRVCQNSTVVTTYSMDSPQCAPSSPEIELRKNEAKRVKPSFS